MNVGSIVATLDRDAT